MSKRYYIPDQQRSVTEVKSLSYDVPVGEISLSMNNYRRSLRIHTLVEYKTQTTVDPLIKILFYNNTRGQKVRTVLLRSRQAILSFSFLALFKTPTSRSLFSSCVTTKQLVSVVCFSHQGDN